MQSDVFHIQKRQEQAFCCFDILLIAHKCKKGIFRLACMPSTTTEILNPMQWEAHILHSKMTVGKGCTDNTMAEMICEVKQIVHWPRAHTNQRYDQTDMLTLSPVAKMYCQGIVRDTMGESGKSFYYRPCIPMPSTTIWTTYSKSTFGNFSITVKIPFQFFKARHYRRI